MNNDYIAPSWLVSENVHAYSTTRCNGYSKKPFDSFNLGDHVGDVANCIVLNRQKLEEDLQLPSTPVWLRQVHGKKVITLEAALHQPPKADAVITQQKGLVCAVMTADCLPILLCDQQGTLVAAIHAGWRGLASGIILECVRKMRMMTNEGAELIAWLGPAIGGNVYEVSQDVVNECLKIFAPKHVQACFKLLESGKYLFDIYQMARHCLAVAGVECVYGGDFCTYTQNDLFFSHRRSGGKTGRMAHLIWLTGD